MKEDDDGTYHGLRQRENPRLLDLSQFSATGHESLMGEPGLIVGAALAVLVGGLYVGLVFPVRYGLADAYLVVRFGLCRQRIPLAAISEVKPTSNPLSAPALSLDRLHIRFGEGVFKAVMISPADRNRFLDELARKAGLNREGERLFRV